MEKLKIILTLVHLNHIRLTDFEDDELKTWLHSIREVSRRIDRELIARERNQYLKPDRNEYGVSLN